MKIALKEKAIILRKQGFSYSEILKQISVAKSTLSLWLHSVGLSKKQKQRLTKRKLAAIQKGGQVKHQQRLNLLEKIQNEARKDIKNLNHRDLWLAGVMLYWAEGTKEKEHNIGNSVAFNNSDPRMIKVFLKWLKEVINVSEEMLKFEIYIHNTANYLKALKFWSQITGCDKNKFKVYFKKHKPKTNRKNISNNYNGLLRIGVRKSSILNRRIAAWIEHISNYWI